MRLTVTPLQITFVMLAFKSISEHGGVRFLQISYQLRVACYPLTTPDEFFWQLKFACITFCLYRNFIYSVCITRINLIFRANQLLFSFYCFVYTTSSFAMVKIAGQMATGSSNLPTKTL